MINQEILREYDIRGIYKKSLTIRRYIKIYHKKLATIIKKLTII